MTLTEASSRWAVAAAEAARSKSATRPVVLAVGEVLAITDFFVIASAPNTRLVRAIAEEVEAQLSAAGGPKPVRTEGLDDMRWVLIDYALFVVHVFVQEARDYYDLERLWRDVPRVWEEPADGPEALAGG